VPTYSGTLEHYCLTGEPLVPRAPEVPLTRTAFAAAHVISDPLAEREPVGHAPAVDWEATLASATGSGTRGLVWRRRWTPRSAAWASTGPRRWS
jgi:hypothetical protein